MNIWSEIVDCWEQAGIEADRQMAEEKARRNNRKLHRGLVLGVSRGLYRHYGVYVGKGKIVHFTSKGSDTSLNNEIMKTGMAHFIRDADEIAVLKFPLEFTGGGKYLSMAGVGPMIAGHQRERALKKQYHFYSSEECASRAESRIGERDYSLLEKNCEHFAIWCKTGIELSIQADIVDAGISVSRRMPSDEYIP